MFEQSIDRELLSLINQIFNEKELFDSFYLAGGTALSLQLGHRKSFDIDLFLENDFNIKDYLDYFIDELQGKIILEEKQTLITSIKDIQISLFYYPYPLIANKAIINNISMASIIDISCMKIIAILQRAEKKDFFDLYEIFKSIEKSYFKVMLIKKFGEKRLNFYQIVKSLSYFDDVEKSLDPISLNNTSWEDVKNYFMKNEANFFSEWIK